MPVFSWHTKSLYGNLFFGSVRFCFAIQLPTIPIKYFGFPLSFKEIDFPSGFRLKNSLYAMIVLERSYHRIKTRHSPHNPGKAWEIVKRKKREVKRQEKTEKWFLMLAFHFLLLTWAPRATSWNKKASAPLGLVKTTTSQRNMAFWHECHVFLWLVRITWYML